jgi:hypothetical protein
MAVNPSLAMRWGGKGPRDYVGRMLLAFPITGRALIQTFLYGDLSENRGKTC